jgi:hypothetical protein
MIEVCPLRDVPVVLKVLSCSKQNRYLRGRSECDRADALARPSVPQGDNHGLKRGGGIERHVHADPIVLV